MGIIHQNVQKRTQQRMKCAKGHHKGHLQLLTKREIITMFINRERIESQLLQGDILHKLTCYLTKIDNFHSMDLHRKLKCKLSRYFPTEIFDI